MYKVDETGQPTPPASAAGPSSSSTPSKVQKPAKRYGSLQAAPENIEKALNSLPEFQDEHDNGSPDPTSSYPSLTPNAPNSHGAPNATFNSPAPQVPQPTSNSTVSTTPKCANCCSKQSQPQEAPANRNSDSGAEQTPQLDGSDSGPKMADPENANRALNHSGLPYSAFPAPQFPSWQHFNATGQGHFNQRFMLPSTPPHSNPIYVNGNPTRTSPPTFSSHQFLSDPTNLSQATMQSGLGGNPHYFTYTPPPTLSGDSCHICTCGDSCQCLGCASHPYNDRTKQYVQEMGTMVTFEKDGNLDPSHNYRDSPFSGKPSTPLLDFSFANSDLDATGTLHRDTAGPTFPEQASNSTYSSNNGFSSFSPEYTPGLLMQPEEYYTLEYPVGLPNPCSDVTGSCQCGNDCCCSGCLTHNGHTGEPVTTTAAAAATAAEDNSFEPAKLHHDPSTSSDQADLGLSRIPVLDEFSDSSLNSPTVDPQVV